MSFILKNRLLAAAFSWISFGIFAQDLPVIRVDQQNLSPVALQVAAAKEQHQPFAFSNPLAFSSEPVYALRGADENAFKSVVADTRLLGKLLSERPQWLSLELPVNERSFATLDLVRVDLLSEGFQLMTTDNNGPVSFEDQAVYYRGVVRGSESASLASISIFPDQLIGSFSSGAGNIVIQPNYEAPGQLILYNDLDITEDVPFECYSDQLEQFHSKTSPRGPQSAGGCVKVYIECDYALYVNKGGISATASWITAVFNNVATLYANESIPTAISEIFIWTTEDGYSKTSSITALNQFKTKRPTFNGDIAHLAALGGNNIGGVAWLDVLCTSYRYAYSNISSTYKSVPTYSWTVEVMTHEMGHNLGSNHTHWCGWPGGPIDNCYTPEGGCSAGHPPQNGGTIMSYCHLTTYGINFSNGFGPLPGDKIRSEVSGATCLGSCGGGGGCTAPSGLNITNIGQTTATGNWNAVSGALSYKFEYKASSSGTWIVASTTSTSYNMTGLSPATTYNTRVKTVCSSGESSYSGTVDFTTAGGTCPTPTNLAASNITETSATVTWSAASGALSYNFQYKLSSSNSWYQVNVPGTGVNMTGMTPGTNYDVRVQSVCSGGTSAFTAVLTFKTLSGSGYCVSKGNNAKYEWVKRVKLGTIDRSSASDNGYYDGTALVTDVNKGSSYTLNYQAGTTGSSGNLYWRVWIDFNNNKSFNDAGELLFSKKTSSTSLLSANITIPAGAATAKVRMRVAVKYGGYSSSCQTFPYGEVEDYSINIKAAGSLEGPVEEFSSVLEDLQVSPNPFEQTLRLSFFSPIEQNVALDIVDAYGRKALEQKLQVTAGSNALSLQTSGLMPANYFLRLRCNDGQYLFKLIKME